MKGLFSMAEEEIKITFTDELFEPLTEEYIKGINIIYEPKEMVKLPELYSLKSDGLVGKDTIELMTIFIPVALLLKPILDSFLKKIGEDLAKLIEKVFRKLLSKNNRFQDDKSNIVKIFCTGDNTIVIVNLAIDYSKLQKYIDTINIWYPSLIKKLCIIYNENQSSPDKLFIKEIDIDDIIGKN